MAANVSYSTGFGRIAERGKAMTVALWTAQITIAGVLGMMAFVKFFNFTPEGSMALAEALGVGRGVVTAIGLVEATVVLLILAPKTRAVGALLGGLAMSGALFSHIAVIGFSGNPAAEMWPLALLLLALSGFVLAARRNELPLIGGRG